jgi:hypothetical protein
MGDNDAKNLGISPDILLPTLLGVHPEARSVFDRYGLRGCGGRLGPHESIHFFARAHGVDERQLLKALEAAIAAHPAKPSGAAIVQTPPGLADVIYRRYFIGGILVVLTVGASWGAWLLWTIAIAGSFQSISINSINAHGEAQIFGWVSLFIMGFGYQAFPRLWQTTLYAPRLAAWAFLLLIAGLVVRTIAISAAGAWTLAPPVALCGGALQVLAIVVFASQIMTTLAHSGARSEPYIGFIIGALVWMVVSGVVSVWHTWNTMTVQTVDALIWSIATYQSPLRDLQLHGMALFMILGVSQRMLPAFYEVPRVPERRAWLALGVLTCAVLGEVVLFLLARWTGNRVFVRFLPLPWAMLAVGCAMVALPWRPWRPFPVQDRSSKFVRAAYAWLCVSLLMLLFSPVYLYAYQHLGAPRPIPFSHAYAGAIRHAITVGFISLMIMGVGAKVTATLNGVDPLSLSRLAGPFSLVNIGCMLRVAMQPLTDWSDGIYPFLGISGTLEVAGLAWWGLGLVVIILRGKRESAAFANPARGPHPARIEEHHRVADVLDWFPETESVFLERGFTAIRQPLMRRTIARQVTLRQAASLKGVPLGEFLAALNGAIARTHSGADLRSIELPVLQTD